jgi:hypothetical protein
MHDELGRAGRAPKAAPRWRRLAYALAQGEPTALDQWLDAHKLDAADMAWLDRQGLAMFALDRLRSNDLLAGISADLATGWDITYQRTLVAAAAADWEMDRAVAALDRAGVDFIWLKGAVLANEFWPNPACRTRGDLDLWIPVERLEAATAALAELGYKVEGKDERPAALSLLVGGEQQMVPDPGRQNAGGSPLALIELQWPALRGEWVRRTGAVDHTGIWQRRRRVLVGEQPGWAMAPEDTLIHLCFHQAINHQFSAPWLRNLMDVHLLASMGALDWSQVTGRAIAWRLATVVWAVLHLAERLLGTVIPAAVMPALAPPRWRRALIERLRLEERTLTMQGGGYGYRRFLVQVALVDRARDAAAFVGRGVAPEAAWLRARYELAPGQPVWPWRVRHLWRLATSARA